MNFGSTDHKPFSRKIFADTASWPVIGFVEKSGLSMGVVTHQECEMMFLRFSLLLLKAEDTSSISNIHTLKKIIWV